MNSEAGRKALVTGGSRGIGRGIARVLAAEGYDVAITWLTAGEEADRTAAEVRALGRRCAVIHGDMGQPETPARVVEEAARELGGLDVLVNNAGITRFDRNIVEDPALMDEVIRVDFKAYLLAAGAAARHMIDHGVKGSLVNITSSRAERAYPYDAVYGGMKAALKRATETLALKYAPHGIRVNCVAPGATAVRETEKALRYREVMTRKIPLGRVGTPEDVGHAVAFLVSEKASYITGISLRVDGGLILPGMPEDDRPGSGWGANAGALKEGRMEIKHG